MLWLVYPLTWRQVYSDPADTCSPHPLQQGPHGPLPSLDQCCLFRIKEVSLRQLLKNTLYTYGVYGHTPVY